MNHIIKEIFNKRITQQKPNLMAMEEIILKICNDKIYFNPELSIPIQQTNIPKDHLTFRTHRDIFWKVEILIDNHDDQSLTVSIKDYNLSNDVMFNDQRQMEVKQLSFDKFVWNKLEPLLTSYQIIKLSADLFDFGDEQSSLENIPSAYHSFLNQSDHLILLQEFDNSPNSGTIEIILWANIDDAHFILGFVTFKKYLKQIDKTLEFKIANNHILAEFDNIKSWFSKALKTKKIKVRATVGIENGILETHAFSEDIDKITPELIDMVKYERTYSLSKATGISGPEKILFTKDDIFSQLGSDNIEENVFNQSDENILNFFLQRKDIRNKKQLEYLAGNKQSGHHKLHYTLKPYFGFLFMIEGIKYNHFVWELLNSNATYLWRIEKRDNEIEMQFKIVESEINKVRTIKRANYKKRYNDDHHDTNIFFQLISHKYINTNPDDNFPLWMSRLEELLT